MWFESLLVLILFKFKKRPNISGILAVHTHTHRDYAKTLPVALTTSVNAVTC